MFRFPKLYPRLRTSSFEAPFTVNVFLVVVGFHGYLSHACFPPTVVILSGLPACESQSKTLTQHMKGVLFPDNRLIV